MLKRSLIIVFSLLAIVVLANMNSNDNIITDPTSPIIPQVYSYPSDPVDPELDPEASEPLPKKKGRVLPKLPVDLKHLPLPKHIEFM